MTSKRRGLSIVELMVALAILGISIAPLASSYWGIGRGLRKVTQQTAATMLARSIMDHIHFKLFNYGTSPYPTITNPPSSPPPFAVDYGPFFTSLAQTASAKVATEVDGERSRYFILFGDPTTAGEWAGIRESTGDQFKQMQAFSCSIEVRLGGLDSDMDGTDEKDMAEVIVRITWSEEGTPREQVLQSIFSKYQYSP